MTERIEIYILSQLQFHFIFFFLKEKHWQGRFTLGLQQGVTAGGAAPPFPTSTREAPVLLAAGLGGPGRAPHRAALPSNLTGPLPPSMPSAM